ncbi:MAG TPA: histidine phosphatase family protein [Anaerolineales bacterium]|nr:histidine phosphatase family protein [Anaerolineales bacterium]
MKTLLLMRHAKSSWNHPETPDHDRPLNKRGKHDAPRMGRLLREQDLVPDHILSSTARRALDTARAVAEACAYEGEIEPQSDLYGSDAECYLDVLRHLPDAAGRVLVVGHNPIMEELVELLTGAIEPMSTGALAQVDVPITGWMELTEACDSTLVRLWTPRSLGD